MEQKRVALEEERKNVDDRLVSSRNSQSMESIDKGKSSTPSFSGREADARVGIGRRPLHYTGSDGWGSRIAWRTLYAAAVGSVAGVGVEVYKGSSQPRWMRIMSTNCALVTASFCGAQELVREIRASDPDDLLNCVPAGLLSGALLGRIQGGRSRALPCALLFALVGTGAQFGVNQLQEYRLKRFIRVSNPELTLKKEEVIEPKVATQKWNFPEWFPIQVLDQEAAAKRKAEKEAEFRNRVKSLHRGDGP